MSLPVAPHGAHADVEHELTRLLRRSRTALGAYAAHVHPDVDLAGYSLLLTLRDATRESGGAVRAVDLAERTGLHKSTMSRGLGALERLGLVERVPDPSDARARLVGLSADGAQRVERVREERRARLSGVLDRWDEHDLRSLARLLDRLTSDLEALP